MKTIEVNGTIIPNDFSDVYSLFGYDYSDPREIKQEIADANGDGLTFEINSPGGFVAAGSEIYTAVREYSGQTVAKVTGQACSAASFIALACDRIMISPTAQMMIHRASGNAEGNTDDFASAYQALDSLDKALVDVYAEKTGMDKQEVYRMMCKTTWLNAKQAVDMGFADEIMFHDEPEMVNADGILPLNMDQIRATKKMLTRYVKKTDEKPVKNDLETKKRQLVKNKLALLFKED